MGDLTPEEAAESLRCSPLWLKEQLRRGLVEHQRYGRRVALTPAQVDAVRARAVVPPVAAVGGSARVRVAGGSVVSLAAALGATGRSQALQRQPRRRRG